MSFFSNTSSRLNIGTRIGAGFGIVLALLLALATLGYFSLTGTQATFEQYAFVSSATLRMAEADRDIVSVRRNLREFIRTGSKESLDGVHQASKETREILDGVATTAVTAEQREQAKRILALLNQFMANFETIIKVQAEGNRAVDDVMNPLGAKLSANIAEIIKAAMDDSDMAGAASAGAAQEQLMQARLDAYQFLLTNDAKLAQTTEQRFTTLSTALKTLSGVTNDDERQAKVQRVIKETPNYVAAFRDAVKVVAERARLVDDVNGKLAADMAKIMSEMKTAQVDGLAALKASSDAGIASTVMFSLALAGVALLLGLGMAWIIGRSISKPIVALVHELGKLADGDFNISLPGLGRKDEIGQISNAAELIVERFGATITNIKASTKEITNASTEISSSTTDLSQRTEEQAASLEETSASMEQMSATVRKNAENAKQASELASTTREVADRGGEVVTKTIAAMAKIEESSRKISDIISVIDEIARQTNLLALNAAVEAARAGEAGRGFAVVASEVRSLAQRSSQAAKDINGLITNSAGQVKEGVDLVNRAGTALDEIVVAIRKVTEVIGDIANASTEQSSGIEQISKALAQMEEVTQQNSALVEENAATAKTLEQQAKAMAMDKRVAFFRPRGAAPSEDALPEDTGEQSVDTAPQSRSPRSALAS